MRLIPAAAEIDAALLNETPPAWNASVGSSVVIAYDPPLAPVFSNLYSASDGVVIVEIAPEPTGIIPLLSIVIEHRAQGTPTWSQLVLPVSQGGTTIDDYSDGDTIELRAFGRALDATDGAITQVILHQIGSGRDASIPTLGASANASGSLAELARQVSVPRLGLTAQAGVSLAGLRRTAKAPVIGTLAADLVRVIGLRRARRTHVLTAVGRAVSRLASLYRGPTTPRLGSVTAGGAAPSNLRRNVGLPTLTARDLGDQSLAPVHIVYLTKRPRTVTLPPARRIIEARDTMTPNWP